MILNYQVFTRHRGECFIFHADSDDSAIEIMTDYLKETDQFQANIYRWCPDSKEFEHKNVILVQIPEKTRLLEQEFKLTTTYIKYISVSGNSTENDFYRKAKDLAETFNKLPEIPGWNKHYFHAESVHCADDDRYGAEVETVKLT